MPLAASLSLTLALAVNSATFPADPVVESSLHEAQVVKMLRGDVDRATTRGGVLRVRWNLDGIDLLGIRSVDAGRGVEQRAPDTWDLQLDAKSSFVIDGGTGQIKSVAGGEGRLQGGFVLRTPTQAIPWTNARFVVRGGEAARIDFETKGEVLFYADKLMFEYAGEGSTAFRIRSADLRVAPALARRLGWPGAADTYVGELHVLSPIAARIESAQPKSCAVPNWPNTPVASAPTQSYRADVFMQSFSGSIMRSRNLTGPGGAGTGEIVIAPSSTLRNNVANGAITTTIPGDPRGTSSSAWTAEVPWYQKFTTNPWPYPFACGGPNEPVCGDQHPYLIWNLYRLDANGAITQVGRSGVKHAFLTVNSGCSEPCGNSHILGRGCADTYGTGNNDSSSSLGPRRELIAATGQWGRCRSVYDPNCDGSPSDAIGSPTTYDNRMVVREATIDSTDFPGATYLFESWYIVRDDIDIYNTMATRGLSLTWNDPDGGGPIPGQWTLQNDTGGVPFRLGSALERWFDAPGAQLSKFSNERSVAGGHLEVAAKAFADGANYRYEFAVMNYDFAQPETSGSEPNLEVLSNRGFSSFSVPVFNGATVSQTSFSDGDTNAANDWTAVVTGDAVVWSAPNLASTLDWGVMHRFTIVANAAPGPARTQLFADDAVKQVRTVDLNALGVGSDALFLDDFE